MPFSEPEIITLRNRRVPKYPLPPKLDKYPNYQ